MANSGPNSNYSDQVSDMDASAPFKLAHMTSPISHKSLTTMPSKAVIEKLGLLRSRSLAGTIRKCIIEIYSHVTQREPMEGIDSFFIHVGATVHYETFNNCFIKGSNHAKKAASILNNIQNTIREIDQCLTNPDFMADTELLTLFKNMLIVHQNAIYRALKNTSPETKLHIKAFANIDADAYKIVNLSAEALAAVVACYPSNDGPDTPKRKTPATQASIRALNPDLVQAPRFRRRLNLDLEGAGEVLSAAAAPAAAAASQTDSLASIFAIIPQGMQWAYDSNRTPTSLPQELDGSFSDDAANAAQPDSDSDQSDEADAGRRSSFFRR